MAHPVLDIDSIFAPLLSEHYNPPEELDDGLIGVAFQNAREVPTAL